MVVFDVEGVVIPAQRYLLEEATLLRHRERLAILLDGALYLMGLRDLKHSLERIYRHFEGIQLNDFAEVFDRIQLIPGAHETLRELRRRGILIALISSGVPEPFVQKIADSVGADYVVGPKLDVRDGKLTGRILGDIIEKDGKGIALADILEKTSISPSACAVVADDRNNLAMFKRGILKIGFNSDFAVTKESEYVVKSNLTEILPIISNDAKQHLSNMPRPRMKYLRETIHVGCALIPFVCQFLGFSRLYISILVLLVAVGYSIGEIFRFQNRDLPPFTTLTRLAATGSEQWDFAAAPLYLALGVLFCLTITPPSGYVGITVLSLGDGTAKIIGRRFGKTVIAFNKPKTIEGTLSGLMISGLVASLYVNPLKAILAAGLGMLAEIVPTPINDNFLVPIVASLTTLAIY
jgi:phosphoserine phosphatase